MNEFFLTRRKKALQHFFWFVIYIYNINIYVLLSKITKLHSKIHRSSLYKLFTLIIFIWPHTQSRNDPTINHSVHQSVRHNTTHSSQGEHSIHRYIYISAVYIYHQIEAQLTALGFAHLNTRYMIDREVRCLLMCVSAFSESESETERDDDPWSWDNQTVKNMRY